MKRNVLLALLIVSVLPLFSQINSFYRIETFASLASGKHTPFGIVNHNWGVVSLSADNYYLKGGIFHEQVLNKDWSFAIGVDGVKASFPPSNCKVVWIQQLYSRLNWKIWQMDVGLKEEYTSFLNSHLSSGDFINSNNARPHPQINICFPQFLLLPHTKGNVFFKGDFSVGKYLDGQWQENRAKPCNQSYTKNVLSHNKSIYFRFGNMETKNKRQFIIGLIHAAQWGGELYYNWQPDKHHAQPNGLKDLIHVVLAQEGSPGSSKADLAHKAGSQWGAYLLKYDYKLNNENRLSVYLQHFFEDGSGMGFQNYRDNLAGVEMYSGNKALLSCFVFEYIYTKQQTGAVHHNNEMDDEHKDRLYKKGNGNDDYYNNCDYVQGPSYFGKTLGTPLLLSPEYNTDGSLNFKGNRIIAFHLGIEGYFHPTFRYRLLYTTGQNWGRYYVPFKTIKTGFASQLELTYSCPKINGLTTTLSVGYDKGDVFGGNSLGAGITLSKRGIIYE